MSFGTMTSRVLGQLRESFLAAYFDKSITDAYNAAFRLPNLFRRVLGEGSLSVSFIPVFIDAKLESQQKAQNLVNSVYTFLLLILGVLTAIGILKPELLLNLMLDQAYKADTEKYLLTMRMASMMFGFLYFISTYAFMMGILNALGQYALPAMAPTFFNIVMIIFTLAPHDWFSVVGDQLALGVLIGGLVQAVILVPALIKAGYFPKLTFNFSNPDFRRVLKSMGPGLLGLGLLQLTTIINTRFASSLPEGTISYIAYVDRLIELPLSLVSVSLGTALLPALSQLSAQKQTEKFGQTARHYLELNMLLTMAAAAGLYALAGPIVQLLFGRGKFDAESVAVTAMILQTYCWIMIFSSGVRVLTPAYYAVKNTWMPATISCVCLVVHILIAPRMMEMFGVRGLMMSTITSAFLNFALLLSFYRRLIGPIEIGALLKNMLIYLMLAGLVGLTAHVYYVIAEFLPPGTLFLLLNITISMGLAITVFLVVGYLFRLSAVREVADKVRRRLRI